MTVDVDLGVAELTLREILELAPGEVLPVTPLSGATRFHERMRAAGNPCELHVYKGFGHLFTPAGTPDDGWPRPDSATAADAGARAERFLASLKFTEKVQP